MSKVVKLPSYVKNDNSWYKDYHKRGKIRTPKLTLVVKAATGEKLRVAVTTIDGEVSSRRLVSLEQPDQC